MFRINVLPATMGDCILMEYGDEQTSHNVLIDGGTGGTRQHLEKAIRAGKRHFQLVVISHIDNDHIAGVLKLLENEAKALGGKKLGFKIDDIWFNGWPQLNNKSSETTEIFGVEQGEKLTLEIRDHKLPWNAKFDGNAVVIANDGILPQKQLPGGLLLTVLSPLPEDLAKMKEVWKRELLVAGLVSGLERAEVPAGAGVERFGTPSTGLLDIVKLANSKFVRDTSEANRSSIALIAEYEGKRVLLAADAHADVLLRGLQRYQADGKIKIDLFKVSHHGAQGTTSLDLIKALDCNRYIVSTNGATYQHPHAEAISRVIMAAGNNPELIFNYKTERNRQWEQIANIAHTHKFRTLYPQDNESGITVEV